MAPVKNAAQQHFEFRQVRIRHFPALDRPPGQEPLALRREAANARQRAVRDDQRLVIDEQGGDVLLVGLQLAERRPDGGGLDRRVLQFDDCQGQPVHKQDNVRPAFVLVLHHGELVHRQVLVVVRGVVVQGADQIPGERAIGTRVLHRHTLHEVAVEGVVIADQRRRIQARQALEGVVDRGGRHLRVQAFERLTQAARENDLGVIVPLGSGFARSDVGAGEHRVADALEPGQGGLFEDGLSQAWPVHLQGALPAERRGCFLLAHGRLAILGEVVPIRLSVQSVQYFAGSIGHVEHPDHVRLRIDPVVVQPEFLEH